MIRAAIGAGRATCHIGRMNKVVYRVRFVPYTIFFSFSAETQDIGSINFSENMTEAMEMTEFKVFLITTGIDEKEVSGLKL